MLAVNNIDRFSGQEKFTLNGIDTSAQVLDFWRWMGSDLNDNLIRAALGEFIVATALGCPSQMSAAAAGEYSIFSRSMDARSRSKHQPTVRFGSSASRLLSSSMSLRK